MIVGGNAAEIHRVEFRWAIPGGAKAGAPILILLAFARAAAIVLTICFSSTRYFIPIGRIVLNNENSTLANTTGISLPQRQLQSCVVTALKMAWLPAT